MFGKLLWVPLGETGDFNRTHTVNKKESKRYGGGRRELMGGCWTLQQEEMFSETETQLAQCCCKKITYCLEPLKVT